MSCVGCRTSSAQVDAEQRVASWYEDEPDYYSGEKNSSIVRVQEPASDAFNYIHILQVNQLAMNKQLAHLWGYGVAGEWLQWVPC